MPDVTDRLTKLHELIERFPDDPECHYSLAFELAKTDADAAIAAYDRAIALDPDFLYAYFHKARAQHESGATEEAQVTIRTGAARARAKGDAKALGELTALAEDLA